MEELAVELVQKIAFETGVMGPSDVVALALTSKAMYGAILGRVGEEDGFDKAQLRALGGPLFCAERGWWDAVVLAVRRGYPDPEGGQSEGSQEAVYVAQVDSEVEHTPLTLACLAGEARVVEELLTGPESVDPRGFPLSLACASGSTECVGLLLAHPRIEPTWRDSLALVVGGQCGHPGVVEALLEDGRADPTSQGPLVIARVAAGGGDGRMDVVRVLLGDNRVDPGTHDNFLLIYAAEMGFPHLVRLLLGAERVDPGARDNEAICMATENAHLDIVRLLLEDGRTDPAAQGNRPLMTAAWNGRVDLVELLLEYRHRLDLRVGIEAAARNGHEDVVALLSAI